MTGQTTREVLRVLRYISQERDVSSVSDICRALNMNTSVAYRACATLEAAGFAERVPHSAKYAAGPEGAFLVSTFLERFPIRHIAMPYLREMVIDTGCAAELFVRIGWYAVRLIAIEPPRQDIPLKRSGETYLLHRSGIQEPYFGEFSEEDRAEYLAHLKRLGLDGDVDSASTGSDTRAEIAGVRNRERTLIGVARISAPDGESTPSGTDAHIKRLQSAVWDLQSPTLDERLIRTSPNDLVLPPG